MLGLRLLGWGVDSGYMLLQCIDFLELFLCLFQLGYCDGGRLEVVCDVVIARLFVYRNIVL